MSDKDPIGGLQERFVEALIVGDQLAADGVVREGLERGLDAARLCVELIGNAQQRIGRLWEGGSVNVADEHLATQIVAGQLARLRDVAAPPHPIGKRVVLTAIENDQHCLGAAMVALVLHLDGWDVQFLGGGVPLPDLLAFVVDRGPDVVGLSVTLPASIPRAGETIAALHALAERPKILVGGAAFEGREDAALEVGADAFAADADAARSVARQLAGLSDPRASLDDYLAGLGRRIQRARKQRGWSQQTLATHTGLTRTYLSSVEQGKRNLSLGALLKIARALDVTPETLVS